MGVLNVISYSANAVQLLMLPITLAYNLATEPIKEGPIIRKYKVNSDCVFVINQTNDSGRVTVSKEDWDKYHPGDVYKCEKLKGCVPLDRESRLF